MNTKSFGWILAAAGLLFWAGCGGPKESGGPAPAKTLRAAVTFVRGQVTVQRNGAAVSVSTDSILNQSDVIETGRSSAVDLLIQGLGAVKLGENTKVRLLTLSEGEANRVQVGLDKGQMASYVQKRRKDDSFQVVTPTAIAGVRGTVFLTTVTPPAKGRQTRVRVSVFSGSVGMRVPGQGDEVVLDRNSQLEVEGMQKLTRDQVRTLSPEALKEMKRLSLDHKSNSLEFNTLVQELEKAAEGQDSATNGGSASQEIGVRKRRMDGDRMATDTVTKAKQREDGSVLKRDVNADELKLKPKEGYRQ